MTAQSFDNIDEQLQKLRDICAEAHKKYKILDDEVDAQENEGIEIQPDLRDKLKQAIKDQKKTVDDYEAFVVSCVNNKVDLTNHWLRLGFSEAEIKKMSQQ
jgi:hypothetical protein